MLVVDLIIVESSENEKYIILWLNSVVFVFGYVM